MTPGEVNYAKHPPVELERVWSLSDCLPRLAHRLNGQQ
jgi:hypothetical protein